MSNANGPLSRENIASLSVKVKASSCVATRQHYFLNIDPSVGTRNAFKLFESAHMIISLRD